MNRAHHQLFGAASWMAVASPAGLPPRMLAVGTASAVAFSVLPDLDNARWFRKADKGIPDEPLGGGGPMQHRGLLHWFGLPLLVAAGLYVPGAGLGGDVGSVIAWGAVVGYLSHLVGDFAFGQAGHGVKKGVPLLPWFLHVGLGFKSDGLVEKVVLPVVAAVMLWWAVDMPGLGYVEGLA